MESEGVESGGREGIRKKKKLKLQEQKEAGGGKPTWEIQGKGTSRLLPPLNVEGDANLEKTWKDQEIFRQIKSSPPLGGLS